MWSKLQTKQQSYLDSHGKYFQLLASGEASLDGGDVSFTVVKPSDEKHPESIEEWNETVPFEIQIHEWVGEDKGYRGVVTVNHEGQLYRRERDSNNVDSGWYSYDPNEK